MVGLTHDEMHVEVGADVEYAWFTLPSVQNVLVLAKEWLPLVKVVAEMVTFQPLPVPVWSATPYCWSLVFWSTAWTLLRLRPALQPSDEGGVRLTDAAKNPNEGVVPESRVAPPFLVEIAEV